MKRLRFAKSYSGDVLAERADISANYLRRIETRRAWPSAKVVDAIARALRVPLHELFLSPKHAVVKR